MKEVQLFNDENIIDKGSSWVVTTERFIFIKKNSRIDICKSHISALSVKRKRHLLLGVLLMLSSLVPLSFAFEEESALIIPAVILFLIGIVISIGKFGLRVYVDGNGILFLKLPNEEIKRIRKSIYSEV